MNFLAKWIVALTLIAQTASTMPRRIGTAAGKLTDRDVAAVLALPGVGKPWLLHEPEAFILNTVAIYLPPDIATNKSRRGKMLTALVQPGQPVRIAGESRYAQVAIEGRSMDNVESNLDPGCPFVVDTDFDEPELLSIVQFIRSKPTAAVSNTVGRPGVVAGNMPIRSITHSAGGVEVNMYLGDYEGQRVLLERKGSSWTAISARNWTA